MKASKVKISSSKHYLQRSGGVFCEEKFKIIGGKIKHSKAFPLGGLVIPSSCVDKQHKTWSLSEQVSHECPYWQSLPNEARRLVDEGKSRRRVTAVVNTSNPEFFRKIT